MRIAIKKWGNSAGMVLPASILRQLHLAIGQDLIVEIHGDELILKSATKKYSLAELIAKCDPDAASAEDMDIWQNNKRMGREEW